MSIQAINHLLAYLPIKEKQDFVSECEPVVLSMGEVLNQSGESIRYAYFPSSAILSLSLVIEDKLCLGIGLVGFEGMVGVPLVLGAQQSQYTVGIHSAGHAMRVNAKLMLNTLKCSVPMQQYFNRYLLVHMTQLAQLAICNRYHLVEARLARLLMMIFNRTQANAFYVTQDVLAKILGVRRVGVTKAALSLHHQGFISYSRGYFQVTNPAGLSSAACSCYQTDNLLYQKGMGHAA